MHFVVMHVTESDEVFNGVLAFVLVMFPMMQLKHFAGIVRRQHSPAPPAFDAISERSAL